jgi:hypothetical protein
MYPRMSLLISAETISDLKATPIDHKKIPHVLRHVVRSASAAVVSESGPKDSSQPTDCRSKSQETHGCWFSFLHSCSSSRQPEELLAADHVVLTAPNFSHQKTMDQGDEKAR